MSDRPYTLMIAPSVYASMRAAQQFAGRDRRRIKREMNKASKRARRPPVETAT